MAKLAILYTGIPDNFEENSKSHKILFDNFDTDVYISTWDTVSLDDTILKYIPSKNVVTVVNNMGLIAQRISDNINRTLPDIDEFWFNALHRCMLGYYHMDVAYKSISFPQYYDVIIRLRFDVLIHENKLDCNKLLNDSKIKYNVYGWRDRINYGHPFGMGIAATVFSTSASGWYVGQHRKAIETLFEHHLLLNNINPVNNFRHFSLKKNESDIRDQTIHS